MSNFAVMPLNDYVETCEAIREKTGATQNIKSGEMVEKINAVFKAGKQSENDRFWDTYQLKGSQHQYWYAFFGLGWTDEIYNPKYSIRSDLATMMFAYSLITNTLVPIEVHSGFERGFYYSHVKTIPSLDVTNATTLKNLFQNTPDLENITFVGSINLDISFSYSKKLSKASVINIMNALSEQTSNLTLTIPLVVVNSQFETSEGANDGSNSNEWQNLVAAKSNWTISLST